MVGDVTTGKDLNAKNKSILLKKQKSRLWVDMGYRGTNKKPFTYKIKY